MPSRTPPDGVHVPHPHGTLQPYGSSAPRLEHHQPERILSFNAPNPPCVNPVNGDLEIGQHIRRSPVIGQQWPMSSNGPQVSRALKPQSHPATPASSSYQLTHSMAIQQMPARRRSSVQSPYSQGRQMSALSAPTSAVDPKPPYPLSIPPHVGSISSPVTPVTPPSAVVEGYPHQSEGLLSAPNSSSNLIFHTDLASYKRRRRRTTSTEKLYLEEHFRLQTKPDTAERRRIAEQIGWSEKAVQIWFQNRRQKVKHEKRGAGLVHRRDSDSTSSAGNNLYEPSKVGSKNSRKEEVYLPNESRTDTSERPLKRSASEAYGADDNERAIGASSMSSMPGDPDLRSVDQSSYAPSLKRLRQANGEVSCSQDSQLESYWGSSRRSSYEYKSRSTSASVEDYSSCEPHAISAIGAEQPHQASRNRWMESPKMHPDRFGSGYDEVDASCRPATNLRRKSFGGTLERQSCGGMSLPSLSEVTSAHYQPSHFSKTFSTGSKEPTERSSTPSVHTIIRSKRISASSYYQPQRTNSDSRAIPVSHLVTCKVEESISEDNSSRGSSYEERLDDGAEDSFTSSSRQMSMVSGPKRRAVSQLRGEKDLSSSVKKEQNVDKDASMMEALLYVCEKEHTALHDDEGESVGAPEDYGPTPPQSQFVERSLDQECHDDREFLVGGSVEHSTRGRTLSRESMTHASWNYPSPSPPPVTTYEADNSRSQEGSPVKASVSSVLSLLNDRISPSPCFTVKELDGEDDQYSDNSRKRQVTGTHTPCASQDKALKYESSTKAADGDPVYDTAANESNPVIAAISEDGSRRSSAEDAFSHSNTSGWRVQFGPLRTPLSSNSVSRNNSPAVKAQLGPLANPTMEELPGLPAALGIPQRGKDHHLQPWAKHARTGEHQNTMMQSPAVSATSSPALRPFEGLESGGTPTSFIPYSRLGDRVSDGLTA